MSKLKTLPPHNLKGLIHFETPDIMRALIRAHKALAELKGYSEVVPNKNILLNAITLNESKDSSEIENIVTTHDELFSALADIKKVTSMSKEVLNYKEAIWHGYKLVKSNGFISTNMIVEIQGIIERNRAGIRKQGGTVLQNEKTKEIVYIPPATESEIRELMADLEKYINEGDDIDPLIKLAVIHYQFESIHPFYDGNGRTGRIINILYLILKDLIDSPILYLSKYIMENKNEYYRLLQKVRTDDLWHDWVLYIVKGVYQTSKNSLAQLKRINDAYNKMTSNIKERLPDIYSRELVDLLFSEFYTRISNVEKALNITRKTASGYLNQLVGLGVLAVETRGRDKIFINEKLIDSINRLSGDIGAK